MMVSRLSLKETLKLCLEISYEAGKILLKYQKRRSEIQVFDKGKEGIATEADLASEEFILGSLKKYFKDDLFISEESDFKEHEQKENKKNEYTWFIDPLDGTNNFVNGIPIYCTSMALCQKDEVILGVVYNPESGECYFATKGEGAYLISYKESPFKKKNLIDTENTKNINESIFSPSTEFYGGVSLSTKISLFKNNIKGARAIRRFGSAALELSYVARGSLDAYWEKSLKPWDIAAASLICLEAKVKIQDFNGLILSPFSESVIAAREPLFSKITSP